MHKSRITRSVYARRYLRRKKCTINHETNHTDFAWHSREISSYGTEIALLPEPPPSTSSRKSKGTMILKSWANWIFPNLLNVFPHLLVTAFEFYCVPARLANKYAVELAVNGYQNHWQLAKSLLSLWLAVIGIRVSTFNPQTMGGMWWLEIRFTLQISPLLCTDSPEKSHREKTRKTCYLQPKYLAGDFFIWEDSM